MTLATEPGGITSNPHAEMSPTGGNFFFAAVKSFDANIAISGNFVLNAKNFKNLLQMQNVIATFYANN